MNVFDNLEETLKYPDDFKTLGHNMKTIQIVAGRKNHLPFAHHSF